MISKRLLKIVDNVPACETAADIGTDHGYVPIALAKRGDVGHIIGMDIRKGPLSKADANVRAEGLAEKIELRLSDGAEKLAAGEADAIVISGMGGSLIQSIMMAREDVFHRSTMILSPQSELDEFRRFLLDSGYHISKEDMIYDEGKYYFIMCVYHDDSFKEEYQEHELYYSRYLLENKDITLYEYLLREKKLVEELIAKLSAIDGESAESRKKANQNKLEIIDKALLMFRG